VQPLVDNYLADRQSIAQLQDAAAKRVMASEDAREGPRAFVEKRTPVWRS